jgi:ribosomal protein L31E
MAENKKSFILYADTFKTVKKLPDELAGKLFKLIFSYVNDENPPEPDDLVLSVAWEPIKNQLKRDLRRWENKKENWSKAGKASAEARKLKKEQTSTDVENVATDLTVNDSVSVTVNDTVNDTVNVNVISHEDKPKNMSELIAGWYNDLPNSSHIETIAMNSGMKKEQVLRKIPEFKKAMDLTYPGYDKFINHFKNWLRKSSTVEGGQEYKPKKRNQI